MCIALLTPDLVMWNIELPGFRNSLPYAIPALLYCVNNNLAVHMQIHMDPLTYQVTMW